MQFRVSSYSTDYFTGVAPNGDQFLFGLLCPNIVVYVFDALGALKDRVTEKWLTAAPQVDGVYLLGDPAFESALNSQLEKIRTKHGILPSTINIESFFDKEFFVGVEIPDEPDSASTSHVFYWAKDYWLNDDGSVHST